MAAPAVQLLVSARPENVSVVRHALAGVGEALGMDEEALANLKTIVSEACNNAVLHAYDEDEDGVLEVSATPEDDALRLVVRDFGHGFRPRLVEPSAPPSLRLGLPLIATLSREFDLRSVEGGGTELRALVELTGQSQAEPPGDAAPVASTTGVTLTSTDDEALSSVIASRVVSAFAARAGFSIDRLSDALLLADAVSSVGADGFSEGRTSIRVEEEGGTLTVRVGPLREGAGESMLNRLAIPTLDASLVTLADEARVEHSEGSEHLLLRIAAG